MSQFFKTLKDLRVAFIGAGVSHRGLIPMFVLGGAKVTLCDARPKSAFAQELKAWKKMAIQMFFGENYLDGLANQDMILRTPGFNFYNPKLQQAAKQGINVTSEMELFFENCPCKIVGITGSDGKTTTTSLIAAMYTQAGRTVHLGGNIGRPLLPIVDTVEENHIAVVELSSFQLVSMKKSPHIAVVTNVAPNHLDHHKDMQEYVDAKRNLLAWQEKGDIAVLNHENVITRGMQKDVMGELRWFSSLRELASGAFLSEDETLCLAEKGACYAAVKKTELKLRGAHNVDNVLAALAALRDEVPLAAMQKVARSFEGVEHRIEPVRVLNGVQWFNDSIATSPTRVIAGLRAFEQKIILIAGGYDKNLPFEPMSEDILQRVKLLILTNGSAADKIEAVLRVNPGFDDSGLVILRAKDLPQAVGLAAKNAINGDIVSLSPACAAFDAYTNFEERGKHYKQLVNCL